MTRLVITATYVGIALFFMLMGRLVSNVLFRSKRTTQQPNLALSVRHGGLYLAIAIASVPVASSLMVDRQMA